MRISERKARLWTILILAVGMLLGVTVWGAISYGRYIHTTEVAIEQMKGEAGAELNGLTPIGEAAYVRRDVIAHEGTGVVGDCFRSELGYDAIKEHYDKEFAREGWRFQREKRALIWGKDVGAMQVSYCKGALEGDLYFVGAQKTTGNITYVVEISWELDGARACSDENMK